MEPLIDQTVEELLEHHTPCSFCGERPVACIFDHELLCERCRDLCQLAGEEVDDGAFNSSFPPMRSLMDLQKAHDLLVLLRRDKALHKTLDLDEAFEIDFDLVVETLCYVLNHDPGYGRVGRLIKRVRFYFMAKSANLDLRPRLRPLLGGKRRGAA